MKGIGYQESVEFLSGFFGETTGHAVELRSFPNDNGAGPVRPLFSRDAEMVVAHCRKWDVDGRGMFFGVCTRITGSHRGRRADLAECPALWADIDTGKMGLDKDKVVAALRTLPFPPSVIVDSGGGLHAYWLLNEAIDVTVDAGDTTGESVTSALKQLAGICAGDLKVCELARVMRLPGTANSKPEVVNDGIPAPCRVIETSKARYELDDLVEWLDWQRPVVERPSASDTVPRAQDDNPYLAAARRMGFEPPLDVEQALAAMTYLGEGDSSIHQTQLRVSASLVAKGIDEDGIVSLLMEATRAAAGHHGSTWNWRREETAIRKMIADARTKGFAPAAALPAEQTVSEATVVDLGAVRAGRAGTATGKTAAGGRRKTEARTNEIRLAGETVIEVWRRERGPLLSTNGLLWAYGEGIWRPVEGALEAGFRVQIQRALVALDGKLTRTVKSDVFQYIVEQAELHRADVRWNHSGLIVGLNGAIDPLSGAIQPHDPDHLASFRVDVAFDREAACPTLLGMLNAYFERASEAERRARLEVLQEWFGSMLARGLPRDQKKALWLHGDKRTGKSRVSAVARLLMGERNLAALDPCDLDDKFSLEALLPASAWIADDVLDEDRVIPGSRFKTIINGEPVSIRRMNRTALTHVFDIPVLFTANTRPRFKDSTDASYDRVLPFRLTRQWSPDEAIPEDLLTERLRQELPGIFNWAVDGLKRLKERGRFEHHRWMDKEVKEFKAGNAIVQEWIDECVTWDPGYRTEINDLVAAMNGFRRASYGAGKSDFGGITIRAALVNRFPDMVTRKSNGRVFYVGLRLSDEGAEMGTSERERRGEGSEWRGSQECPRQPIF